jgi:hypothetical protein
MKKEKLPLKYLCVPVTLLVQFPRTACSKQLQVVV